MFKAAVTREKRAITLRKKWQQKINYFEKRAADGKKVTQMPSRRVSDAGEIKAAVGVVNDKPLVTA
jgi:hypothetical protein